MIKSLLSKFIKKLGDMRRHLLYYRIWPGVYRRAAKQPIDEKKVLLATNISDHLPDNLSCMKDELEKRGMRCVELLAPAGAGSIKGRFEELRQNLRFQREYATSAYVFVEDAFFPLYANYPREGTRVIQLWHACGAFKKWGYSTADLKWGASRASLERYPIHNTYTDVTVSAEKVVPYYAEAFNCPESIIRPLGVPRTDVYFDESFVSCARSEILKMYPQIGVRKIILYAPTFRGDSILKSYMDLKLDIERMSAELSEEYVLLYKLHPQTARRFSLDSAEREKYADFVFDISSGVRIDTAMCAADMLISDYSSVIFEYSLLGRPMIFFAYDLEEYDRDRSFYNKYEDFVPGPIVRDTEGIISAVRSAQSEFDWSVVERFRNDFMSACDGGSTARIADTFIGKIGESQ